VVDQHVLYVSSPVSQSQWNGGRYEMTVPVHGKVPGEMPTWNREVNRESREQPDRDQGSFIARISLSMSLSE
jgi:hypothetical protein